MKKLKVTMEGELFFPDNVTFQPLSFPAYFKIGKTRYTFFGFGIDRLKKKKPGEWELVSLTNKEIEKLGISIGKFDVQTQVVR